MHSFVPAFVACNQERVASQSSQFVAFASHGLPTCIDDELQACLHTGMRGVPMVGQYDGLGARLMGRNIVIFVDFQFEDLEVMYTKIRLEEEGAKVIVCGIHEAPMKYTGKYGYPVTSDVAVDALDASLVDALILPGGFAPGSG